jgi:hypothetical protein
VVNLESAIAITQNFIPRSHLKAALDFLEKKPDQISGFSNHIKDPYQLFIDKLTLNRLEIIEQLHLIKGKKRKWEQLLEENGDDNKKGKGGFSFGFADDEAEEVP